MLASCKISIEGCPVFPLCKDNTPTETLANLMKNDEIKISIDFSSGDACATAWGCDMTEKYVKINANYLT